MKGGVGFPVVLVRTSIVSMQQQQQPVISRDGSYSHLQQRVASRMYVLETIPFLETLQS